MKRKIGLVRLFLEFMKLGFFTFGGGWSIIAQMQRMYVEDKKLITAEELLDITSVGRSLPGLMIGNVSMLFGCRVGGVAAGVLCTLGLVIPPIVTLSVIAFFYTAFRTNVWVGAAMDGIRCAIVPIILSAAAGMVKGAFRFPPCYAVLALTLALYLFLHMNCVYLVLIGAVCGIIMCEIYERTSKGGAK